MCVEVDEASENVGDGGREGRLKERQNELLRGGWFNSGNGLVGFGAAVRGGDGLSAGLCESYEEKELDILHEVHYEMLYNGYTGEYSYFTALRGRKLAYINYHSGVRNCLD